MAQPAEVAERGARSGRSAPQTAYARLRDAARLNPLSDEADLVAGSIALRYGELTRADREFSLALARTPGRRLRDARAGRDRLGQQANAQRRCALLERAVRLNPRDPLARSEALSSCATGGA